MAFNIEILSKLAIDPNSSAKSINQTIGGREFRNRLESVKVKLEANMTQRELGSFRQSVRDIANSAFDSGKQPAVKVGIEVDKSDAVKSINAALQDAAKNLKSIKVDIDARVDDETLRKQLQQPTGAGQSAGARKPVLDTEKGITNEREKQFNIGRMTLKQGQETLFNSSKRAAQFKTENAALDSQRGSLVSLKTEYSSINALQRDFKKLFSEAGYEIDIVDRKVDHLETGMQEVTIEARKFNQELQRHQNMSVKAVQNQAGNFVPTRKIETDETSSAENRQHRAAIGLIQERIRANEKLISSGSHISSTLRAQNRELTELTKKEQLSVNTTKQVLHSQEVRRRQMDQEARARRLQIQLLSQHTKALQQHHRFIDRGGMKTLQSQIQGVNVAASNSVPQLQNMQQQLRGYTNQAAQATRSQMGIIENFNNAMVKFPIWMGASTLFFGAIRSARTFIDTIIDIDSKMVTLQKVMSDSANMDQVFNDASRAAERFGQTISDVLDAYAEFARQGYEGVDLSNFGDAALITANVGEMSAQQASEFLTAATAQWQTASQDAMSQVDSWNNISNNYATTMEKLGEGHAKAGATAKAMGLDFDETNAVIGALTAQTKQSGSEIGNFIKSAFPRMYAGAGKKVFEELGIEMETVNGETKDAITLLREVSFAMDDLSQADQADAIRGLGGVWHYQRMQVLLETLKDTNGMYDQMLESSRNSAGSAAAENAIYMESLEAKVNKAKVAIEELSLALGEAFLESGIIEFLTSFATTLTNVANLMSDYPNIAKAGFGVIIAYLASMSKGARGFYQSLWAIPDAYKRIRASAERAAQAQTYMNRTPVNVAPSVGAVGNNSLTKEMAQARNLQNQSTQSALLLTNAQKGLTRSTTAVSAATQGMSRVQRATTQVTAAQVTQTNLLTAAKKAGSRAAAGLAAAFRGILSATGVGLAIAGVTWAIEKFINSSAEATQEANTFAQTQDVLKQSMEADADRVHQLVDAHDMLEQKISSGNYTSEDLEKHNETSREMAQLFPDLVAGSEEYGNTLSNQQGIIESRIALIESQIESEKELARVQGEAARQEAINKGLDAEDDFDSKLGGLQTDYSKQNLYNQRGAMQEDSRAFADAFENELKLLAAAQNVNDVLEAQNAIKERANEIQNNDPELYAQLKGRIEEVNNAMVNTSADMQLSQSQIQAGLNSVADGYIAKIAEVVNKTDGLGNNVSQLFGTLGNEVAGLNLSIDSTRDIFSQLENSLLQDTGFQEKMSSYETAVKNFQEASSPEEKVAEIENIKLAYEDMASSISDSLSNIGIPEDEINKTVAALEQQINSFLGVEDAMSGTIDDVVAYDNALMEAEGGMDGASASADGLSDSLDDQAYSWQNANSAMKEFTDEMRALEGQLGTIHGAMEELTETGMIDTSTFYDLLDIYPELLNMQLTEAELLDFLQEKADETYQLQNSRYNAQLGDNAEMQEGIVSNEEVTTIEKAKKYAIDAENFGMMGQYKEDIDLLQAASRDGNEADVVNELASKYGIDLSNFTGLAGNKQAVEQELMSLIIAEWNDYIGQMDAEIDRIGGAMIGLGSDFTKGGAAGVVRGISVSRYIQHNPQSSLANRSLSTLGASGSLGHNGNVSASLPDWVKGKSDVDAFTNSLDHNRDALNKLGNSGVGSGKKLDDFGGRAGKAGSGAKKAGKGAAGAAKGIGSAAKEAKEAAKEIKDLGIEVEQLTKTFTKNTFVLNQHEESLRKINNQLERQNLQTQKYATHSAAYRRSLERENKLNEQKLKVMQQQERSLEQQIKSGRINEYGIVGEDFNVAYNNYNVTQQPSEGGRTTTTVTQASGGNNGSRSVSPFAGWKVNYGYSPKGGGKYAQNIGYNGGRHHGIDFGGKSGQTVRTPHGGQVIQSGWSRYGGGNQVQVYNKALDRTFTFMHMLGDLSVKAGQTIQAGQKIGRMGSTGNSTGTHLHFQVNTGRGLNNSRSVNPNNYLTSRSGSVTGSTVTSTKTVKTSPSKLGKSMSEQTASYLNELEQAQLASIEESINKHNAGEENKSKVQEAREQLDQMALDRLSLMAEMRENDFKIIESQIEAYDVNRDSLNHKITELEYRADRSARLAGNTSDSAEWRKYMNRAKTERERQLRYQQEQVAYIEQVLAADSRKSRSNRMNQAHRFQLEERMREAKEQVVSLRRDIDEAQTALMTSRVNQTLQELDAEMKKIDNTMTMIEHKRNFIDSTYESGAKAHIKNLKEEISLLNRRSTTMDKSIVTLKNLRSNLRTQPELYKQVNEKIEEMEDGLRAAQVRIHEINREIKTMEVNKLIERLTKNLEKAQKQFNKLQDSLHYINQEGQQDLYFNTQADVLEEMQEYKETIEGNISELQKMEKQVKRFPEVHKRVTDELKNWQDQLKTVNQNMHTLRAEFASSFTESIKTIYQTQKDLALEAIDEEMSEYEKMINKKIELIDKQAREENFAEDIADRQEAIQKIRDEIAQRMGDDSLQNQKVLKDLREELDNLEKDYNKTLRDKEREDRKEALQEEIEDARELANDKRENTEEMFDDMLNDQRQFNQIQEQIMQGNIDKYKEMYKELTKFINENMKDIGKSVSEGMLDSITTPFEALQTITKLLNEFHKDVAVPESGLTPIDHTWDKTLSELIQGVSNSTSLMNLGVSPTLPSLNTQKPVPNNTTNNNNNFGSLLNIENFRGTEREKDNLVKQLETELRKLGVVWR